MNESDLTAAYQYGPLALGGYQSRKRKSKEGSDVYLGKSAAFVLKDHYDSDEAKKKRAALKERFDDLEDEIAKLKKNGGSAGSSDAQKKLDAIKAALGIK